MKVQIKETLYKQVALDEKEIERVVIDTLERVYDMGSYSFIDEKGNLMIEVENHGSHSWFTNEFIRKATEKDKVAIMVFKQVKEFFHES